MREPTFSADTMAMHGPLMDGGTHAVYCSPLCAEQSGEATEDSLFEVEGVPGDVCALCGKALFPAEQPPGKGEAV